MYEPEKIYVQNAGIDPGVAALMQNASKGNMDPAALMAMMNNGGMGGNGGWWIWIILLFFMWGGRGFGANGEAGRVASELNTDANTNLLMHAINGNKDAISSLAGTLNCDINSIQSALNSISNGVSQISCDTKLASCEVINAITSGNAGLASKLAECCCTTQRSIDNVNNNITKFGYESQLAILNQTNTLQSAGQSQTSLIAAKIDAQTTLINDKFCQLEMREMQSKIDTLRSEKAALEAAALTQAQTANIINQLKPCPSPSYIVPNPNCCYGGYPFAANCEGNCGC